MTLRKRKTPTNKTKEENLSSPWTARTPPSKKVHRIYCHPHYPKALILSQIPFLLITLYYGLKAQESFEELSDSRRLSESTDCFPNKVEAWEIPFCILGVLYMFLGLSVVCDEFFVPALEVIADNWNLSNDVAGATLMAAGGSAPELFTSYIGTFRMSDVGFGTIVGSAVFNILFVIGMCALCSTEPLVLTWWPLARDCFYYTISLLMLSVFFTMVSPTEIYWWEALILFILYIIYVVFMKYNMMIKEKLFGKSKKRKSEAYTKLRQKLEPTAFELGLLGLLVGRHTVENDIMNRAVLQISGDVKETFDQFDLNKTGSIGVTELGKLLKKLGLEVEPEELKGLCIKILDGEDGDTINFKQFKKWYIQCEERVMKDMKELFQSMDLDNSNSLSIFEIAEILNQSEVIVARELEEHYKGPKTELSFKEFEKWYVDTEFYQSEVQKRASIAAVVEEVDDVNLLSIPDGTVPKVMFFLTLPLVLMLFFTLADVRKPGKKKWAFLSFFGSIAWIGIYSWFMVDWCQMIGDTVGIPQVVMGLTFLAAGTSVPDLLSSVIVAKQGHGDMAVSSSVGSNIFDILVGLPLPWMSFGFVFSKPVKVYASSLSVSLAILIAMLIIVVVSIHLSKWVMTKTLGYSMFFFYVVFVVQDLIRAKWTC